MRENLRRRALAAASVGTLLATGACTSITWQDGDGVRHHLGLVAIQTLEQDGARVVRRFAVGSDLDVSRGGAWALGLSRAERIRVFETDVTDPRELQRAYLAELSADAPRPSPPATWRFLYVVDEDSDRAAIDRRTVIGLAAATGPELRGLYVGYADGVAIDPRVVGDDAVLHVGWTRGYDPRYRFWRLVREEPVVTGR